MKPIRFRASAEADLRAIVDHYSGFSDDTAQKVLDDIYRAINHLATFPYLGRPIGRRGLRRLVTLKHHFLVGYVVEAEALTILGIFRHQDRET